MMENMKFQSLISDSKDNLRTSTECHLIQSSLYGKAEGAGNSVLAMAGRVVQKVEEYDDYYQVSAKVSQVLPSYHYKIL